jgi:hypothetical protein
VTRQYRPLFPPVSSGRDAIAGQSLESAVASDNQGNMCCPQSRKNFNTEEAARTTENHGARIQSAARKAQFAFYSVVLRRPPCFLRVENLPDVPSPQSPRRKTKGEPVKSHADAIQAIVLMPIAIVVYTHRLSIALRYADAASRRANSLSIRRPSISTISKHHP